MARHFAALALLLAAPALLSAADPLATVRSEAEAAEREVKRLEAAAARAGDEAARLRSEREAAAQSILAAEARLSEAEVRLRLAQAALDRRSARLAEGQRPAALLLGGLTRMSRQPPLLTLADGASAREFVITRALLDTSLPEIRRRTASLRTEVEAGKRLAADAAEARTAIAAARTALARRQERFATLEAEANRRVAELGGEAIAAGDLALARTAEADRLAERGAAERSAARVAASLRALDPAPPRPAPTAERLAPPPLRWQVPVAGPVRTGLAEISAAGVRSRGLTIAAARGAGVVAPAEGRIAFAGPFRSHQSVIVIDHGRGWMTLMTGVRTTLATGTRLSAGERIGSALGPVTVELSRDGQPQPAALIAGSSALLSNRSKAG